MFNPKFENVLLALDCQNFARKELWHRTYRLATTDALQTDDTSHQRLDIAVGKKMLKLEEIMRYKITQYINIL